MTGVQACEIVAINDGACRAWLDHVLRGAPPPAPKLLGAPAWLLCHSDDGVTWGVRDDGGWRLGSSVFPGLCPHVSATTLQEGRLFSAAGEVLMWRSDEGLRGRILRDAAAPGGDASCSPHDEERILLAGHVAEHRDGFTRVGDGTGAEQALPLLVTEGGPNACPRLRVRHYFARDAETGCVRVAATRLVEVQ